MEQFRHAKRLNSRIRSNKIKRIHIIQCWYPNQLELKAGFATLHRHLFKTSLYVCPAFEDVKWQVRFYSYLCFDPKICNINRRTHMCKLLICIKRKFLAFFYIQFCITGRDESRTHLSELPAGRPHLRTPQVEAFLEPPCIRIQSQREGASADRTTNLCFSSSFYQHIICFLLSGKLPV